jgi:hypothetical protein
MKRAKLAFIMLCVLIPVKVGAQTNLNIIVLKGLAPVDVLPNLPMHQRFSNCSECDFCAS